MWLKPAMAKAFIAVRGMLLFSPKFAYNSATAS